MSGRPFFYVNGSETHMLLLETSRKSAFRRHSLEAGSERGTQSSVGAQRSKRNSFQNEDVDFLASLRRQKDADLPAEDEE
jgi:hypothetical protein